MHLNGTVHNWIVLIVPNTDCIMKKILVLMALVCAVLNVSAQETTLKVGDTVIENAEVEYIITNAEVVSVEDGVIHADAVGNTVILVKVTYQGQEASVTLAVTVIEN